MKLCVGLQAKFVGEITDLYKLCNDIIHGANTMNAGKLDMFSSF